jgi:hypothetical protein
LEDERTEALSFHGTTIVFQMGWKDGIEGLQKREVWGTLAAELVNTSDLNKVPDYARFEYFKADLLRAWTVFLRIGLHGLVLVLSDSQLRWMSYFSAVHVSFFL